MTYKKLKIYEISMYRKASNNFIANLMVEGHAYRQPELSKDTAEKVTDFDATDNDMPLFCLSNC